ncbi:hypothetical protein GCM10009628_11570 [Paeniglutamicibacter kerguelensis]
MITWAASNGPSNLTATGRVLWKAASAERLSSSAVAVFSAGIAKLVAIAGEIASGATARLKARTAPNPVLMKVLRVIFPTL